ncbi:MAG: choice-of-anchor D domain-containing protein [Bryobacteraceae bacterium]
MTARILWLASLLPLTAMAQIQLFQFDGTNDNPVGSLFNVGAAAAGDTITTRFHVKNIGSGPQTFQTLSLSGVGFNISAAPSLPYIIAPGSEAEFDVAFSPTSNGNYGAFLVVNTLNVALQGMGVAAAVLTLTGSSTPLAAGAVIDFGSVDTGSGKTQGFTLANTGSASLTVSSITVTGTGFSGPTGLTAPVQLAPGQTASFQVTFQPQTGTAAQGTLTIDQRSFTLTGLGLQPLVPTASIELASTLGASAQQNSVSVTLASASQVSGTGTLTLAFASSVPGVSDDPAIEFLSGPKREATVTIAPGAASATFNGQPNIAFQTGTTAGTITFTLTLPNATQQTSLTIAPAGVNIDSAGAVRLTDEINVSMDGFDNTYSASQLVFTFYDAKGNVIQPGAISVNAASSFQQYFATTTAGGTFALLANFPVTGNEADVASFDLAITNSVGVVTTQHVTF